MILGWIGLVLLALSYVILNTRWSKWFLTIDIIASLILALHAIMIGDVPFIVINTFIAIMLFIKQLTGGVK